ncbi:mage protein [Niveomyces insectorum RCEF 264]|uniref:Mage protein n=1 Tax=Niveomyces insectorum RCEF 264 TaxID=1081102 RepID=A0A167UUR1_9HYPO|nr:mage protein [Niveomyces insectorum RCEF 264]
MPSLSQRVRRQRRLGSGDEHEERRRRPQRVEEEEDEAEEDQDEEDDEPVRSNHQQQQQRRRRRAYEPDEADEADEPSDSDADSAADSDDDDDDAQTQVDRHRLYHELLAKKLVRYALACEPRRLPIRRQAVKEQVLDNQGTHFRKILPLAQTQLRAIFGMEMVEWPARDEATMNLRERRKALKTQKAATAATASAPSASSAAAPATRADRYVLVSTLSDAYRASVFAPLANVPPPAAAAAAATTVPPLAPLPPAPDAAYVGFCTLVVALITLSGGALAHADLEKYLTLLHGGRHGPVRADANLLVPVAAAMGDHIDDDNGGGGGGGGNNAQQDSDVAQGGTMQHLVKQGYVVRVVEAPTTAEGRGPVGNRSGGGGGSSGAKVTWHVGPRGRLEIGPAEVAAVVRHVYGPAGGAGLEQRLQSSLRVGGPDNDGGGGEDNAA